MQKLASLALISCVLAPTLLLGACSTYEGVIEDLKFMDWTAGSGPSGSQSENFLADGCPQAGAAPELGTIADFANNAQPSGQTLISYTKISSVQSKCDYGSQSVTVDIKLSFEGQLGPIGRSMNKDTFQHPFFVAVTSPNGAILAKEIFTANLTYAPGSDRTTYFESMRQIIPIPNKDAGQNFKILAGFQLTQEQLDYNRAVIAADAAAREERARALKAQADAERKAAKLGASKADPEVIVVPDTTTPEAMPGATPGPVEQQPLVPPEKASPNNAPVSLTKPN